MKLTKKKAIELSIKKWKYIVNRNGRSEFVTKYLPEIQNFYRYCGLCELYQHTINNELSRCAKCPIRPDVQYFFLNESDGCCQDGHPFHIWSHNKTKENAQAVLDLILSIKTKDNLIKRIVNKFKK
jgi:hypothetical protein